MSAPQNTPATAAWAYMVRCADGSLYSGWTNDLARRLRAHQTGKGARYTCMRGAGGRVTLAYAEPCADKSAALKREAALKKLSKAEKEALAAAWAAANACTVRPAAAADVPAVTALCNWYIANSDAIFQNAPETAAAIAAAMARGPCLVAVNAAGDLLGFAWAHPWAEKDGFAWDAETTIYLAPHCVGQGIGGRLYAALLDDLRAAGYYNVYARITHPNPGSEAFHRRFGFVRYGLEPHTAYKAGRWLDLGYWRLALREAEGEPEPVAGQGCTVDGTPPLSPCPKNG